MIAIVAQFSSGMLLQGMGRHQRFARGLLVEAIAVLVSLVFVLPRYGILGVAWTTCICMILNRGIFAPWLVTRELKISFPWFMNSIYTWPMLAAVPVAALAYRLLHQVTCRAIPGFSSLPWVRWFTVVYFGLAFFVCLPAIHRTQVIGLAMRTLGLRTQPADAAT